MLKLRGDTDVVMFDAHSLQVQYVITKGKVLKKLEHTYVTIKTRGILSTVCTFPLLDIHGLKYDSETFAEV
jgi:hypothetical protein